MKKAVFILLFIPLYSLLYSQQAVDEIKKAETQDQEVPVKKLEYSMQTGSMFYAGSVKGSTFYFAPEFTYRFSPKLKLQGGVMLMNNNYNYSAANFLFEQSDNRLFSQPSKYEAVVYAKGDYKVNSKLTFTGSIIKNFNDQPGNLQNRAWNNTFQMMSMGFNYKITPNMTIGAGFRYIENNGLNYNPMLYNLSPLSTSHFSDY